jgi:Flp pilus assembly protein TadG
MKLRISTRSRGQELVEFALTLPILILLIMAILDLGRAVYYYSAIHNASREAARFGIVQPDPPAAAGLIQGRARNFAIGLEQARLQVDVFFPTDQVQVRLTYQFQPVTPLIGALLPQNPLPLRTQSTMHLEQ